MKKIILQTAVALLSIAMLSSMAFAVSDTDSTSDAELQKDILMGPGQVFLETKHDILMSYGARARIIPTSETDWDFGLTDDLGSMKLLGGGLTQNFFKNHITETGWINNNYIRSEVQLYFTAMPKDKMWSFYAALEYDRPLENSSVDERGGKDQFSSNFGLERLHGTFKLPMNMRLHAGYDIWGVDVIDAAGLVYGDDNPGFWVTGDYDKWSFNVGYFKLLENNFQTDVNKLRDLSDSDRDLYGGYLTFTPEEGQKIQPFYMYDRIRDVSTGSLLNYIMGNTGATPKTDSHHIGAYYTGKFGKLELFVEGVYQFGKAEETGLAYNDYDISAYAFSGDIALKLDTDKGFGIKPHIGFLYTTGDDDPNDDELGGYTGVENAQRFAQYFGGENTIIGDTNLVLGSVLYGYLPELYGNGTPIATGGLQNGLGRFGNGRGDNPGLTMSSVGITLAPERFLILKSNVNSFWWNEDIMVNSFVDPGAATIVESGYTGTEWDNEIMLATSKHSFIKGQFSCFFPGGTVEDVTSALTSFRNPATGAVIPGAKSDDTAYRLGMEFIWMF
ncbi:MAG: hypothetical protein C4548_15855 [Desulfobacteraceae bacterium]|jgi:hypothetical protein|nr:MAG: hypothetical protein C4548_15855 [Desulfobacteraceae bacterium]